MAPVITAILFVSALASTAFAATKVSFPFTPISAASLPWWIAKESRYYEKHGLDVDMIYVGASPVIIQAMLGGQAGVGAGGEFLIQGLVARKSYAVKNREVVIGMIKATMEGIKQIFVNEKHTKAILTKYTRQTDPEILDQTHKFALDIFVKDPTVTPGSIQPIVQQSAQFNLIDAKLAPNTPMSAYYDNSYVEEIKRS